MSRPQLVGPRGEVISSSSFTNKKAEPPKTGPAFGHWAGRDVEFLRLPGGDVIQIDLSALTLSDFRQMRDHYQVNSSLAVLSFMQHQSEWHIECEDKKIRDFIDEQIRKNWTMLNRGLAQSNWAGYSPMVLEFENIGRRIELTKVKDLHPEECVVNWKKEEGWAPPGRTRPKFNTYDGIKQYGAAWPIPVENTLWYPMLMENGDYAGRKLLRPAFTSWFFSIMLHLYANRYYERFGEPVPIGRAPYDDDIEVGGKRVQGNEYMLSVLENLRNRSVVVLPNDKQQLADGKMAFDYDLQYLESQMRGADFERYMTRLDEEISLALFTPLLLMRTADVGSYNLGVGHMQMYLWMLNAMNDDRKIYLDKYIINKLVDYNFGPNAPRASIKFRKLGNSDTQLLREVLTALIQKGSVKPDVEELGTLSGLSLTEIKETVQPAPQAPAEEGNGGEEAEEEPAAAASSGRTRAPSTSPRPNAAAVAKRMVARVASQVARAYEGDVISDTTISLGFKNILLDAYKKDGVLEPEQAVENVFDDLDHAIARLAAAGTAAFDTADEFMAVIAPVIERRVERGF